jgi:hypothetical protein
METERPALVVLPQAKDANKFYREVKFFLSEDQVNIGP